MTERLYYHDSSLLNFDAVVTRVGESEGRFLVYLDRSAFYPTSGGQTHDLGLLNDIAVVDVIETRDGEVAHVVEKAAFNVGSTVHGRVDAGRRLKNRQQHTAQHILSQLFVKKLGAETVSVHLGDDYGAVELDIGTMNDSVAREVENEANAIVAANQQIAVLFVSGDELAELPLRRPPKREGLVRVIRIGDLDWSACGGTHCSWTAEVGIVKIIGVEKIRGHALVKFLAGRQAIEDYRMRFDITDNLAKALTCHPGDLSAKVEKLTSDNKSLRRDLAQLQKELLPVRARTLTDKDAVYGTIHIVAETITDIDGGLIGTLASMVAEAIGGVAILVCDQRVVLAAAASCGLAADQLARELCKLATLKGGGNARIAQLGGGDPKKLTEYRDILVALVRNA